MPTTVPHQAERALIDAVQTALILTGDVEEFALALVDAIVYAHDEIGNSGNAGCMTDAAHIEAAVRSAAASISAVQRKFDRGL